MRRNGVGLFVSSVLTAFDAFPAEQNWAGEYADKNFLKGEAVFQMSIQQSGNAHPSRL